MRMRVRMLVRLEAHGVTVGRGGEGPYSIEQSVGHGYFGIGLITG
jgi:hypothetical protein